MRSIVTLSTVPVPCNAKGTGYSINNNGYINNPRTEQSYVGTHLVYEDKKDITDKVNHYILGKEQLIEDKGALYGVVAKNGLYCYITKNDAVPGVLSFGDYFFVSPNGTEWHSDEETFILVAEYEDEIEYKKITVKKVKVL
jgi:hypothetical protein